MKPIRINELKKSMNKLPTIGTTKKAFSNTAIKDRHENRLKCCIKDDFQSAAGVERQMQECK